MLVYACFLRYVPLTRQFLFQILVVLVTEAVCRNQGTCFGVACERSIGV